MRNILIVGSIILAAVVWQVKSTQRHAAAVREYQQNATKKTDNCTDKKFCAVVYVAPWCPACQQMAPQLRTAIERAKTKNNFGLKVVVGQGTREQNEAEAASFGAAGSADQDNVVHTALGVDRYPSFFVMDQEKTVILRHEEAFAWLNEQLQ